MRTCHRQNESHGNLGDTVSEIFENKGQLSVTSLENIVIILKNIIVSSHRKKTLLKPKSEQKKYFDSGA